MTNLRLVIFDCDGTLVDTEAPSNQAFSKFLKGLDIDISPERLIHEFAGLSDQVILQKISQQTGVFIPDNSAAQVSQLQMDVFKDGVAPVPGVDEAIQLIKGNGYRLCVASTSSIERITFTLKGAGLLEHFGDRLFSATQVTRGKPFPDVFLHAAATMGNAPNECCVVEDTVHGVTAGTAAGMRVFAYSPRGEDEQFTKLGAVPFKSMSLLPSLISKLG